MLHPLWGQQPGTSGAAVQRRYLSNRADEDWSFLKNRTLRKDSWDPLKFIPLPRENWFLTLSGEARLSPQGLRIRGDSVQPATIDNYLLQRYLFGADLHMGSHFRFFAELQSGIINGRIASPRPNDQDLLELHQGFFEYKTGNESRRFLVRAGRQELNIGSGRLIAPSQGLNVKRSFDGLSTHFQAGPWTVDGGVARLVRILPGLFDDPPDSEQEFWGLNVTRQAVPFKTSQTSVYYLGIDRKRSTYVQGIGHEQRHTIGGRFSGKWRKMDFNYELIGQWGTFRALPVRAWAVSTDTGVALKVGPFPGRLGLTANRASGDKDPRDGSLESFNPLFPGNSYSGIVGLLGPTNLSDLTPSVRIRLPGAVVLAFEAPSYFRTSSRDGVYAIDQRLLLPGQTNLYKYVGTNPSVIVSWQVTTHIDVSGAVTRFLSGKFLADTFVRNGFGFYSIAATYRF
ncbi:MAG: alginate export family protein [Bryobacterales bacterium]|nr:alginate export family protein [Bryobacterales bacterium]